MLREETQFNVEITPELEKGVADMCNLSAGIERQGIEKGLQMAIQGLSYGNGVWIRYGQENGRIKKETYVS